MTRYSSLTSRILKDLKLDVLSRISEMPTYIPPQESRPTFWPKSGLGRGKKMGHPVKLALSATEAVRYCHHGKTWSQIQNHISFSNSRAQPGHNLTWVAVHLARPLLFPGKATAPSR